MTMTKKKKQKRGGAHESPPVAAGGDDMELVPVSDELAAKIDAEILATSPELAQGAEYTASWGVTYYRDDVDGRWCAPDDLEADALVSPEEDAAVALRRAAGIG